MLFADKILSQKLERTEGLSNVDFVKTRAQMFPESGVEWMEAAGGFAMFDGIESPLTQTFGLGMFEEVTPAVLDSVEAFFKKRNAPIFHEVSPLANASFIALLNERDYQPIEFSSILYRSLTEKINLAVPLNQKITTRVVKPDETELWARTSANGWATEMEGLAEFMFEFGQISARCANGVAFIAEIESEPISTGMLFINKDVALLAGASTVPEKRGQGAQSALLDARLRFAADRGCEIAMMGAAPGRQSQKNAEKNDFRMAYTRTKWQLKS